MLVLLPPSSQYQSLSCGIRSDKGTPYVAAAAFFLFSCMPQRTHVPRATSAAIGERHVTLPLPSHSSYFSWHLLLLLPLFLSPPLNRNKIRCTTDILRWGASVSAAAAYALSLPPLPPLSPLDPPSPLIQACHCSRCHPPLVWKQFTRCCRWCPLPALTHPHLSLRGLEYARPVCAILHYGGTASCVAAAAFFHLPHNHSSPLEIKYTRPAAFVWYHTQRVCVSAAAFLLSSLPSINTRTAVCLLHP